MTDDYDIAIIGAGPNGLYCGYRCREVFSTARIAMLERGEVAETLRQLPNVLWHSPMKDLKLPCCINDVIDDDYHPTSQDLANYYTYFCRANNLSPMTGCDVVDIQRDAPENDFYRIEYRLRERSCAIRARAIILATGNYGNPRKPDFDCGTEFCTTRVDLDARNRNLLLVGGGNSAVDFIIHLLPNNRITWVIRKPCWDPVFADISHIFEHAMVRHRHNLTTHFNTTVTEISLDRICTLSNGTVLRDIDQCVALVGFNAVSPLLTGIGLEFDHECLKLSDCYETSLPNVYAFGSLMARWDNGRPGATYIQNGNGEQLALIVRRIQERELSGVMDCSRELHDAIPVPVRATGFRLCSFVRRLAGKLLKRMPVPVRSMVDRRRSVVRRRLAGS